MFCRRCCVRFGGSAAAALLLLPALLLTPAPQLAHAICSPGSVLIPGSAYTAPPNPRVALPLDLNEDGVLDLVVCSSNAGGSSGSVSVFIGNETGGAGDGTFTPGPTYATGTLSLAVTSGDFNADDILDLAVTNLSGQSVSILLGAGVGGVGDGTFAPAVSYPIGGAPYGVASADFDEDGITDLVVADNAASFLRILVGQGSGGVGDGTFVPGISLGLPNLPLSVVTGDFDENGHADIACTASYSGKVAVFLGFGDGSFAPVGLYAAGLEPYDLVTDDLDGDGIGDLIVGNGATGGVAVLLGQGSGGVGNGTFGPPQIGGLGVVSAGSVVPGDFDGDGVMDVVTAHSAAGKIFFMRGVGDGVLAAPIQVATGNFPIGMHAADFNSDGLLDVAVANYEGAPLNRLVILLGFCASQPFGPAPVLDDVRDVPNDQGGKVFVVWQRSSYDGLDGTSVTGYRVWRRIPPALAVSRIGAGVRATAAVRTRALPDAAGGMLVTYWEAVAQLPAQRLEGYGYTAATTQDSMRTGNPFTAFFVTALTADPGIFYDSEVDSGYSVDNLQPGAPAGFIGAHVPGAGFELTWEPAAEADVLEYRLHRGVTETFEPSEQNLLATLDEPGYVDAEAFGQYFYKLAAVDEHDNVGEWALLEPSASVGIDPTAPPAFALHGIQPNPNRGGPLSVSFALEREGPAELRLVDLAGRAVALRRGSFAPGRYTLEVAVDRALSPGVYFLTLVQGAQTARLKVTVIR